MSKEKKVIAETALVFGIIGVGLTALFKPEMVFNVAVYSTILGIGVGLLRAWAKTPGL